MTDPMLPTPWCVSTVARETHDTFTLTLQSSDARHGRFAPGQFDMRWAYGVADIPVSISGDAADADRVETLADRQQHRRRVGLVITVLAAVALFGATVAWVVFR